MGLVYTQEDHIGFFVIDNPLTQNALDFDTIRQFKEALDHFNSDRTIWVGIISGSGEKTFCSGIDIKNTFARKAEKTLPPTLMRGLETNKPLVAAINGAALGGGFELALTCDIRIASTNAIFGFPEVKLGMIPAWGGTQRIVRQLSWAQASALLLTGRTITSQEALNAGLVNEITGSDRLMSTALQWANQLCQAAPLAVQAAKEAMQKGIRLTFDEGLQMEDAIYTSLKYTDDFQEGLKAFREKRRPHFKGE